MRVTIIINPYPYFLLALLSTDSWMESAIKKRQEKKGKSSQPIATTTDPFLEINRYFAQPRLRREDCPNPIPWWGVHFSVLLYYPGFNHLLVSTWGSSSSDDGSRLLGHSGNHLYC